MPNSVEYDSKTDCILVTVVGTLDLTLFGRTAAAIAGCLKEHPGCRHVLIDLHQARPPESVFDIYDMPQEARARGVSPRIKRALVVDGDLSPFRFLETVSINQGHPVRLFNDMGEARKWLFGGRSTP